MQRDIETSTQLEAICTQFPLLLIHQITSNDLRLQFKENKPFPIAWYGEPVDSMTNSNFKYIRTLASNSHSVEFEPLEEQTTRYPDLKQQIEILQIKSYIKL